MAQEASKLLASLLDRVKEQLAFEYHDEEERAHRLENMTVLDLLEMLSYMGWEPESNP